MSTAGTRFCALLILVAGTLVGPLEAAMPDWRPVSPEELAMTREPKAPDARAVILYLSIVRDDRQNREYLYRQVKVLNEDGRDLANIEISYDDSREKLRDIEARTIRKDGTVVPFTGEVFEKPLATGAGRKLKARTLALTGVEVGSIIEYRFARVGIRGLYDTRWLLANDLYTREAHYSFRPRLPVRYGTPRGLPPGTPPITQGDGGYLELHTRDVPAFIQEEFAPPAGDLMHRLDFIYAWDFDRPAKDPEKFWARYAKEQRMITERFLRSSGDLRAAVQEIAPVTDAPPERLRKLYEACQELRNKSYGPERSEEELERDEKGLALSVREVWRRREGWRSQIDLLFMAMAREAGFEAAEVWVGDRSDGFFDLRQMDPGPLATRVIAVRVDGKDQYFLPGARFVPFGTLPWTATGQQGLRIDRKTHSWEVVPHPQSADSRSLFAARLKLSAGGVLQGQVTVTQTGQQALWRRNRENNEDAVHRREFLKDDLLRNLGDAATVRVSKEPDWEGSGEFVTEYEVTLKDRVLDAGGRWIFPQAFFAADTNKAFQRAERVQPVYIWYPYESREDVEIELPAGASVDALPEGKFSDVKRASYAIDTLKLGGGTPAVRTRRRVKMDVMLMAAETYPVLRDFYAAVRAGDEQQIVIGRGKK